jgi:hypothetical protein
MNLPEVAKHNYCIGGVHLFMGAFDIDAGCLDSGVRGYRLYHCIFCMDWGRPAAGGLNSNELAKLSE